MKEIILASGTFLAPPPIRERLARPDPLEEEERLSLLQHLPSDVAASPLMGPFARAGNARDAVTAAESRASRLLRNEVFPALAAYADHVEGLRERGRVAAGGGLQQDRDGAGRHGRGHARSRVGDVAAAGQERADRVARALATAVRRLLRSPRVARGAMSCQDRQGLEDLGGGGVGAEGGEEGLVAGVLGRGESEGDVDGGLAGGGPTGATWGSQPAGAMPRPLPDGRGTR